MKTIRGLHNALFLLGLGLMGFVLGCGEDTDQPFKETAQDVQLSSVAGLSQTNGTQTPQMANGQMQEGMGGMMMMHQNGNMPMPGDPAQQNGMGQTPGMDSPDMMKMMEEMMSDEHHQAMHKAMKDMPAMCRQEPASQPQEKPPAEPPPVEPEEPAQDDEHEQHHQ